MSTSPFFRSSFLAPSILGKPEGKVTALQDQDQSRKVDNSHMHQVPVPRKSLFQDPVVARHFSPEQGTRCGWERRKGKGKLAANRKIRSSSGETRNEDEARRRAALSTVHQSVSSQTGRQRRSFRPVGSVGS